MREGRDPSVLCVKGPLLHLKGREVDMIVDAALGEEGDVLEAVVVLDNVVKVGVTFTTNVLKCFDFKPWLGRMFGAAFRVDLAMVNDRLQPGEVLVVLGNDDFKILRVLGEG